MATWINVYNSDDPWDENPPLLGSFDYDRVLRFNEAAAAVGRSRSGLGTTGDPSRETINEQALLRTACGRWVCEHFLQRPSDKPEVNYRFYSDEVAANWLRSHHMQNVVEHYFGTPAAMPPGSEFQADGDLILFQPDADASARIDAYAASLGVDRRYSLYWLRLQGLDLAEATTGPDSSDTSQAADHPG
ncbi:hypothetical protein GCM10010168_79390 [Actinoplanes ianthinogenes]|uniref:Uncharacterized protein n=1 Tax=Actinoplanes ianthinogenes TaxID=122358 RepID=A0ABM7LK26_9ACTN|nr:hypothetical protein [Actinoplanes ianthinogenes]BCJ39606.1 hypothetical protein Aiant_02630 [Actinoplanes ianthinogenes]GGR48587.1 hypothetical protein GCM10010168_79390 [Actinoplanes ianthinogenes]